MLNVYCRLVVCSAYVLAMHFVAVHEMVSPLPKLLIDCQHPCRVIDADVDVVTGILKPLAHVHRQGVLHRGLTPDHVLV